MFGDDFSLYQRYKKYIDTLQAKHDGEYTNLGITRANSQLHLNKVGLVRVIDSCTSIYDDLQKETQEIKKKVEIDQKLVSQEEDRLRKILEGKRKIIYKI